MLGGRGLERYPVTAVITCISESRDPARKCPLLRRFSVMKWAILPQFPTHANMFVSSHTRAGCLKLNTHVM